MKDTFYTVLSVIPFVMMSKHDGETRFSISVPELLRSVLVPFIIGGLGVFVTVQMMKKDIEFQASTLARIEVQVSTLCKDFSTLKQEFAVVKTRQDERLEREAAQGIRKMNGR